MSLGNRIGVLITTAGGACVALIVEMLCGFIHAAPRQGPPAPGSQGVISASVVVAPGQIFYAKFIQKPCI